jgi:hypothetical protein
MARRSARSASRPLVAAVRAALAAVAVTGTVLAGGCAVHNGTGRGSVPRCTQFGVEAIRHRVTVHMLPPACRGLSRAQVSFAVGSALHSAAAGVRGRALRRARIGQASRYLAALVQAGTAGMAGTAGPAGPGRPSLGGPPGPQPSRTATGLAALGTWLATAGLGASMMLRWLPRRRGRLRRPPALNAAHLGLAVTGLGTWAAYLASGQAGLAWAAAALLVPVTGLGMSLAFLAPAGTPSAAGSPATGPTRARRAPVLALAAHILLASATILLAFLAAVGSR